MERLRRSAPDQWFCVLAIAAGLFLRVDRFWTPSLWLDELVTFYVAAGNWGSLLDRSLLNKQPGLYFALVKVFAWGGHNEFFLRLPAVIAGVATLWLLMKMVREVAGSPAGFYAGAFWALNSRAILHSQEARMYGLALFAAVLSTCLLLRALDKGGKGVLLAYAAAALLTAYSHLLFSSLVLAQTLVCLVLWRRGLAGAVPVLRVQGVVLLLLLPLARLAISFSGRPYGIFVAPLDARWLGRFVSWPETAFVLAATALALPSLWRRRRYLRQLGNQEARLLAVGLAYFAWLPAALAISFLGIAPLNEARYLTPALLGAVLVAAILVARADSSWLSQIVRLLLVSLLALQLAIRVNIGPWVGVPREDWRGAIAWIEQQHGPGDVVLVHSGLVEAKFLDPATPGASEYLAAPLSGFYNRRPLESINLPWEARDLPSSPWTTDSIRQRVARAPRVLVLMNSQASGWNWGEFEDWIAASGGPPLPRLTATFGILEVRSYRQGP